MNLSLIFLFSLIVLLIWNIVLTGLIVKFKKRNDQFFETDKKNVYDYLESVVADNRKFNTRSEKVERGLDEIAAVMRKGFQKLGIVRYNPFHDTGGDMSFSVALLDLEDSGIVLTSIHGRQADRVYAKPIIKGKSTHNLSAEELEAIKKALRHEN
ncbi:MAG: DUF4446 family protein [bacterium]